MIKSFSVFGAISFLVAFLLGNPTTATATETSSAVELAIDVFNTPDPLATYALLSQTDQLQVLLVVEQNPGVYVLPMRAARGYNYYTDLTRSTAEALWCVTTYGLPACDKASMDATAASNDAGVRFPAATLSDGKGDAYRHCSWNALMTKHLDSGRAAAIATKHESYSTGSLASIEMDLYNNKMGRTAALNSPSVSSAISKCYVWANDGTLKTLK